MSNLYCQKGLEGVIVEEFCTTEESDVEGLSNTTTYRVYVDLAEGYSLQAIYGNGNHPLIFKSTGTVFNEAVRGQETGNWINARKFDVEGVMLDSYITLSSISNNYCGVLLEEDSDGSILTNEIFETGSENLLEKDGLVECKQIAIQKVEMDLSAFDKECGELNFYTTNGALGVMDPLYGPTDSNRILIAQITTTGDISFEINLQIGLPEGGAEQYVARNAKGNEVEAPELIYPQSKE